MIRSITDNKDPFSINELNAGKHLNNQFPRRFPGTLQRTVHYLVSYRLTEEKLFQVVFKQRLKSFFSS